MRGINPGTLTGFKDPCGIFPPCSEETGIPNMPGGSFETEESYTSKSSFLDNDFLPTFGAKPESWKPSGRRVKRGQYKTAHGTLINADCNGAANILRKVATQLGLNLAEVSRAVLNLPKRYELFKSLSKAYRKRCVREASALHSVRILSTVATSA